MKQFEYVLSALLMAGFIRSKYYEDAFVGDVRSSLIGITDTTRDNLAKQCTNISTSFGMLYNAFTEPQIADRFAGMHNNGVENIYADSGGLQVITRGKTVNEEMRRRIYKSQLYSDYAMCFDEIALSSLRKSKSPSSERTNTGNKVFHEADHKEAAINTGKNIREQCEFFQSEGAKTKVICIIQGNTVDDMVEFYNRLAEQLDDHHYDNIGGFAVADTCMGNKELESIDMLRAAHYISNNSHDNLRRQMHLLGVGSVMRMAPVLQLSKTKYLDKIDVISYDSTSHTMAFNNGKWHNGNLSLIRDKKLDQDLQTVYDHFKHIYEHVMPFDRFADEVLFNEEGRWAQSVQYKGIYESTDVNKVVMSATFPYAYTMFLIEKFVVGLDRFGPATSDKVNKALSFLDQVDNEDDMAAWLGEFKKYLTSSRIKRHEDTNTLDQFFS